MSPSNPTYADLASLIEYPLLAPDLSEEDLSRACDLAKSYEIASIIVRPCDIEAAARWIGGSSVRLSARLDGEHGDATTSVKTYAARDLLRRGACEIDTALNTGKLRSRQFQYLEMELLQIAEACHQADAILKVSLESQWLNEELTIVACRILRRAGADFAAASSLDDLTLLKTHSRERLRLKSRGEAAELGAALAFWEAGCTRIESSRPAAILDDWKARLTPQQTQQPTPAA
jgi:deoxyribose-phosphate aldolase